MSLRILVCGSRDWSDAQAIHDRLALVPYVQPYAPTVIHGACSRKVKLVEQSADMLADRAARDLGMFVERFPADWSRGKRAGPERNRRMLDTNPDVVLAFQRNGSSGTQDTVDEARKRGIPVEVFTS